MLATMLAGGLLTWPGRASQEIYTGWSWICGKLDTSNEILVPNSGGGAPVEVLENESIEFTVRKEKIPNGCEVVKWTWDLNVGEFLQLAVSNGSYRAVIDSSSLTYRHSWNDKGDIYLGVVIDYFPYTVKFDAAVPGGAYSGSTARITDRRYPDSFALTKNGFGRTGYDFAGWTNEVGTAFADGATVNGERLGVTTNRTVVLYAVWEPIVYDVVYEGVDPAFAATQPLKQTHGVALALDTPEREGYVFADWTESLAGRVKTFTARWTPVSTELVYQLDGGVFGAYHPDSCTFDAVREISAPTKKGYFFAGWTATGDVNVETAHWGTSPSPDRSFGMDDTLANGSGGSVYIRNLATFDGSVVTLRATWKPISYFVDYDYAGGAGGSETTTNVYGTMFFVANPIRPGFTFRGWDVPGGTSGSKDGRAGYWFSSLASENGRAVKLTAQWEGMRYKVALDLAGGAIRSSIAVATCGESFRLAAPTREGYLFAGWTATGGLDVREAKWGVSSNPSRAFDSDVVAANGDTGDVWFRDLSLTANAEVRLQAQWTPIRYFIDYAFDGGTPGEELVREAAYDENVLVSDPTKDGKVFAGWAYPVTNENDEVVWITYVPRKVLDGARQFRNLAAEDGAVVTLTARWGDVTGHVDFNVSGATNNPDLGQDVTLGQEYGCVTTVPTWSEGTFGGYYTEPYGQGTMYWDAGGQPTKETWDLPIATGDKFAVYPLKVGKPYHLRFFETETTNNISFISVVCTNGIASAAMSIRPYATTRTVDGKRERQGGWVPIGDSYDVCLTNIYPFSTILTGDAQFALQGENQVMNFKPHWVVDESPEDDPESEYKYVYTIRFYGNGGVNSDGRVYEDKSVRGDSDSGVGLTAYKNRFSRPGYDFLGWTTDPVGTGKIYTNETLNQSNVGYGRMLRLYAVWAPIVEEDDPSDDPSPVASTNKLSFTTLTSYLYFTNHTDSTTWFDVYMQRKPVNLNTKATQKISTEVTTSGVVGFTYRVSDNLTGDASVTVNGVSLSGSGTTNLHVETKIEWEVRDLLGNAAPMQMLLVSNITWQAEAEEPEEPSEPDDPAVDPTHPEAPMSIAITYRLNDGTGPGTNVYDNVTCEANGKVGALPSPDPWWDGAHQFLGWTTNACPYFPTMPGDGTYFVSSETALSTNDVTFYAAWRTGTVEVVFHDVGPDGTGTTNVVYQLGETFASRWPSFERNGFRFVGCYYDASVYGGGYVLGDDIATFKTTDLYARWEAVKPVAGADEVIVSWLLDDGATSVWKRASCKTNEAFGAAWPRDPWKHGVEFDGWVDERDRPVAASTIVSAAVTNLYVTWKGAASSSEKETVTFYLDDGTEWARIVCVKGLRYEESAPWPDDPVRTGHVFAGWYSGSEKIESDAAAGVVIPELYAHWNEVDPSAGIRHDPLPEDVPVTFYRNDGTAAIWTTVYCKTGEVPTAVWPGAPTRDGFDFTGWWTASRGGVEVVSNAVLNVTALYAGWTESKPGPIDEPEDPPDDPPDDPDDPPDDPIDDPEPVDPITILFPSGETGAFEGSKAVTYLGWLQDASSNIVAALQVKTAKVSKKDDFRSTITVTPVGGRKRTVRATVDASSAHPVDEYGIVYGHNGLSGVFEGYAVVAARTQTETTLPKGVWSFARDGATGRTLYSVAISTKNKAKVTALLPNGKKVTLSTTAVMGEEVFAVTAVSTKRNAEFAEVFLLNPATAPESGLVGDLVFDFETIPVVREYLATVDGHCVLPTGVVVTATAKKWTAPKTVGSVKVDVKTGVPYVKVTKNKTPQNLGALKIKYTSSTGLVSGSFRLYYLDGKKLKYETVSFSGFVIDGELVATAVNKKTDESFAVTATK